MPAPVIRAYLLRDVVDSTPEAVMTLNASSWPSLDDIPPYMYTSLCTLWTGSSGNIADYEVSIVANSGQGADPSSNEISISAWLCESAYVQDQYQEGSFMHSDFLGAENALVRIGLKTEVSPTEEVWDRIKMAEARIRLLLDGKLRGQSGFPPNIPITASADHSIDATDPQVFLCQWLGGETEPNSSQWVINYAVSYVRDFGKAILPD